MAVIVDKIDDLHMDVPPSSAYFTSIIEAATRDAWEDSKYAKTPITDLMPYVEAQFNYYASKKDWAKSLKVQGEYLDTKEWINIKQRIFDINDPRVKEAFKNHDNSAVIDAVMSAHYSEYMSLTQEEKNQYIKSDGKGSSGFHAYLKHKLY